MPYGDFRKYLQENIRQQEYRQPKRVREERAAEKSRQLSREAQRNREKAQSMGRGFVLFLAVVSVAVLFCCVNYLQLKSDLTGKMKTVAALEIRIISGKRRQQCIRKSGDFQM